MELIESLKLSVVFNKIMQKVAEEERVDLVDIVSKFKNFSEVDNKLLFIHPEYDFIHPNALGHKLIAKEIYNVLVQHNILNLKNKNSTSEYSCEKNQISFN